jgi:hypothetical protein
LRNLPIIAENLATSPTKGTERPERPERLERSEKGSGRSTLRGRLFSSKGSSLYKERVLGLATKLEEVWAQPNFSMEEQFMPAFNQLVQYAKDNVDSVSNSADRKAIQEAVQNGILGNGSQFIYY